MKVNERFENLVLSVNRYVDDQINNRLLVIHFLDEIDRIAAAAISKRQHLLAVKEFGRATEALIIQSRIPDHPIELLAAKQKHAAAAAVVRFLIGQRQADAEPAADIDSAASP